MPPVLSILIPTVKSRRHTLARLMRWFEPQLTDAIKIVTFETTSHAEGGPTTGAKRQQLIEQANTPFVCMFDDDDKPGTDFCRDILEAIKSDVVVFGIESGGNRISFGFDGWWQATGGYMPTPSHLSPIRREIALAVGYANQTIGEDADYSLRLRAMFDGKLRETFINKPLYQYQLR